MKSRTNLAYSGLRSVQTQQKNRNKIEKKIHIGRIYRNKVRARLKFYVFSIVFATAFLSIFILKLVERNEITASLNSVKKHLQVQTSENVRLKTQLEQKINIQKIEKYAKENLGMKPLRNQQINYIKINNGGKAAIENSINSSNSKQNIFNDFLNKIKRMRHLKS